jgi:hypothetical protein
MTGAQAQSAAAYGAGGAWRLAALTALAMALTALTAAGPTLHLAYGGWMLWGIFIAGGVGIWAALQLADKVDARHALLVILTGALAMRLALLFADPYLSTDIYRYVWDGRVQAAGINPYRYMPAASELAPLRDVAIFPNINRPDTAVTIYPPAAQAIFLAVTRILGESVIAMKLGLIAFEALTVATLMGLLRRLGHRSPSGRSLAAAISTPPCAHCSSPASSCSCAAAAGRSLPPFFARRDMGRRAARGSSLRAPPCWQAPS